MIEYKDGSLLVDGALVADLAQEYGTPLYVYSYEQLASNCNMYNRISSKIPIELHYAVKANGNLSILKNIATLGMGFDVVSGGELRRCLCVGADAGAIVYSGVGKSVEELNFAITSRIGCINVESVQELQRISAIATELNLGANVSIRVNPHIDANTHRYISTALADSKFGIDYGEALDVCIQAASLPNINLKGIVCHLGSQIESLGPYDQACDSLLDIHDRLLEKSISVEHIGLGGGLAIAYYDKIKVPQPQELVTMVESRLSKRNLRLSLEPGRSIVGNSGLTVSRVEYIKKNSSKEFVIVDAAMNDVPRPALYQAWHKIEAVQKKDAVVMEDCDVVGPICESTDFLGKNRTLAVSQGDLVAIFDTGAYSSAMASNYNSRPRAASVLVRDGVVTMISKREGFEQLIEIER